MELKPAKVTTTISNLKTKEKYKTEEEWKAKGIPEKDIRRDVHVLMPMWVGMTLLLAGLLCVILAARGGKDFAGE